MSIYILFASFILTPSPNRLLISTLITLSPGPITSINENTSFTPDTGSFYYSNKLLTKETKARFGYRPSCKRCDGSGYESSMCTHCDLYNHHDVTPVMAMAE